MGHISRMPLFVVLVSSVLAALVCVGVWATIITLRKKPRVASPAFAAPAASLSSTAAATDGSVVSEDRSAQIDATRKAAEARSAEEASMHKEINELSAARKSVVEPFVGDELSGYI